MTIGSNPLLQLIPKTPAAATDSMVWRWATVTSVSPLQIQIDTEDEPLDAPPSTLVPVAVGDRVFLLIAGRRATIIGKSSSMVDSGVVSLAGVAPFDGSVSEASSVARYGNQVTLSLVIATTAATQAGAGSLVLTLPAGFRPAFSQYPAGYGGLANLGIFPGGSVRCYSTLSSGTTFRVSLSYYTSDPWPQG